LTLAPGRYRPRSYTYLLGFLFNGTAAPLAPYLPFCGLDHTADTLSSCEYVPLCR